MNKRLALGVLIVYMVFFTASMLQAWGGDTYQGQSSDGSSVWSNSSSDGSWSVSKKNSDGTVETIMGVGVLGMLAAIAKLKGG